MTAAKLALQLILMMGLGILIYRIRIVGDNFDTQLSSLIMKLLLPCMIIKSMTGASSPEQLKNCGALLLVSVICWALTSLIGQLLYRVSGRTFTGRLLRFGAVYVNFTFMGIPVMETLFGEQGIFYFVIFIIPYRLAYYSLSEPLLSPPGAQRKAKTPAQVLKLLLSPTLISVFVGLFFYFTQIPLPSPVTGVINSFAACASPLGMLLSGVTLAKYEFRRLLRPRYLIYPLVFNLFMPLVFIAVALLARLEAQLAQIVVMFGALPIASMVVPFTIQYDPAQEHQFESAAAVFSSVLFSAATIPLWANIIPLLFH